MNQILNTKLNENYNKKDETPNIEESNFKKKHISFLKLQLFISIFVIFLLGSSVSYYHFNIKNKEQLSNRLINNYNISRLYANNSPESEDITPNNLFGIIEIPKINIYYPIFSTLSEDLLKISPCKFYGGSLQENGNVCIAGHNYDNSLFFSNLRLLETDDIIYIYDYSGTRYVYYIYDIYEVKNNDLSPILDYDESKKELTLVTCNNLNSNRLIIKAFQK